MKLLALLICFAGIASAETLALVCTEPDATCDNAVAAFAATGDFTSVVGFDVTNITAATESTLLSEISGFDAVIAWTDLAPTDPTGSAAIGDALASYYALGNKKLTVAAYGLNSGFGITGAVMTGGDAALTDTGTTTNATGVINAVVPNDQVFNGITLSDVGYFGIGVDNPDLAAGATLLATSGNGVDLIARSALGVVDVDLYPGHVPANSVPGDEIYQLLANTVAPEPGTLGFVGAGFIGLLIARSRRRKVQS